MTRRADLWRRPLRSMAVLIAACLLLSACPGDAAMEKESPFAFFIDVPKRGDPQEAHFGPTDTEALGLDSPVVTSREGPTFDFFLVATSLAESTAQGAEYCFVEPVMLIVGSTETVLVEPGVCVASGNRGIDRTGTVTPEP